MSKYKSEIRQSSLLALGDKARKDNYGKYLKSMTLTKVRGFKDVAVRFDFPVTALVGPNGGGKTTILGAAGLAYRDVSPGRFFAKSGKYDESMKDWSIEYSLIDKEMSRATAVARTASFKRAKWNRHALGRRVLVFGVSRTVPATERKELVRATGNKFTAASVVELDNAVADAVQKILGRPVRGFSRLSIDASGRVTMYTGVTPDGAGYSEFHFGAGEASVIGIVNDIESAEENTLS